MEPHAASSPPEGASTHDEPAGGSSASRFIIDRRHRGNAATITVEGELDIATADELRAEVSAALGQSPESVLIDLGATTFVDSSGLGALLSAREEAAGKGVRLRLVRSRAAHYVFELCGMDRVLPFVDAGRDV